MNAEHDHDSARTPGPDDSHVASRMWRVLEAAQRAGNDPLADLSIALGDRLSLDAVERSIFAPQAAMFSGFGDAKALLATGAPIEIIRAMRSTAKLGLGPEAIDIPTRRRSLLAFGLVVAAGLVHHGTMETRAPRESVEELLLVIAGSESEWMATLAASALGVLATFE